MWRLLLTMLVMFRSRWALFGALAVLTAGVPVAGAAPSDNSDRIRELQEEIGEASAEEAAALADLADVRASRQELDRAVARLDGEIASAQAALQARQAEVDALTARALGLERRLERIERRLRDAHDDFGASVAALYRSGRTDARAYASFVFDVSTPGELFAGTHYLEDVSSTRWDAVEQFTGLRQEAQRLRVEVEARRSDAEGARAAAVSERERLDGLRAEQEERRREASAQEGREARIVASIRARVDAFNAELAALQATSSAVSSMLASLQAGQARASSFHVVRPVPGEVTSGFGTRVHPILGTTRVHTGVDMHAGSGTPVRAGAAGKVVWAGWRGGYGNAVVIDHGNQYATLYGHLSAVWVSVGDRVDAGDHVGAVGATGMATGPHLHFEVRILGVPVDPRHYL